MNTLSRNSYDHLISLAKDKANLVDQPVAIVVWDIKEDGNDSAFELVVCHQGFAGRENMEAVNKLLEEHKDAEILEMIGPAY
jgi:hypothetical protein